MAVRRKYDYKKERRKRFNLEHKCIDCGILSETYRCDQCNAVANANAIKWRAKNKDKLREYYIRFHSKHPDAAKINGRIYNARQYGMTTEEYRENMKKPCGICGEHKSKMTIDHCHKTNMVRGVLCSACNSRLGWYEKLSSEIVSWVEHGGVK